MSKVNGAKEDLLYVLNNTLNSKTSFVWLHYNSVSSSSPCFLEEFSVLLWSPFAVATVYYYYCANARLILVLCWAQDLSYFNDLLPFPEEPLVLADWKYLSESL